MSLQIKTIALYARNGRIRTLAFRAGQVNIITGKSDTGKSALIAIIEYCLGRSDFKVPEGIISDSVAWYAVVYTLGDMEILIAKPTPTPGASSQSEAYLDVAPKIDLPPLDALKINSNDAAVVTYLTRAIGIGANISTVEEGQSRDQVEATLKHTRYYLFQDQGTVASEHALFHRQSEPFMALAIKDTLPYFLGVYDDDRVRALEELRTTRRELKLAEQRLREEQRLSANESRRASALLAEAQQAGLVNPGRRLDSESAVLTALQEIMTWQPKRPAEPTNNRAEALRRELRQRRADFDRLSAQIQAAEAFLAEGNAFSREASSQTTRLSSLGLFKESNDPICPLCHSSLSAPPPTVAAMSDLLKRLNSDLSSVARERPHLEGHLATLKEERDRVRQELRQFESTLTALVNEQAESSRLNDETARSARVVGRVSLYLEATANLGSDEALRTEVERKKERVELLASKVSADEDQQKLQSVLSWIAAQMTRWAEALNLEFKGHPYRFDLKNLTVVADRDGRPILLGKRMGGGENWLGCHLITLLALHKFFILNQRPVPGFLVLDQPTQVYFPPDRYRRMEGRPEEVLDEDRVAVQRMYDFLFAICQELSPNLQIIVLDHANLDTEEFQAALVEEPWRGEQALIPPDWK